MDAPPDSTLIHFALDGASSDEDPMELPDVLPRIIAADEYDIEDVDFFEAREEDEHPDPQALEIIRGIRVAIDEEGDPNDSQAGREFRDELCRQLTQIQ